MIMKKNNYNGVIIVHKEKGYTSQDVAAIIKKITHSKAGHTGTLDPDATGVLPICVGRITKFAEYFASADKTYEAEIILGITTNTGDISGEILSQTSQSEINYEQEVITIAVESFQGEYFQIPPMYSAIKIGGKKLYELARRGQTIERPPRLVNIQKIQVTSFAPEKNAFNIEVTCSKGTYIRSLAEDIGKKLGCGATMGELIRTRSGIFSIENALKLDEIKGAFQFCHSALDAESPNLRGLRVKPIITEITMPSCILSVDQVLPFPHAFVRDEGLKLARNGNAIPLELVNGVDESSDKYWLLEQDFLIGLFRLENGKLRPEVMM